MATACPSWPGKVCVAATRVGSTLGHAGTLRVTMLGRLFYHGHLQQRVIMVVQDPLMFMQRLYFFVVAIGVTLSWANSALAEEGEFRPLFNGKNLDGWVLVNTPPETWRVEDQMLICSGKPIGELRTDRMYQNFVLEVEWRHMVPRGNAGIFVWADDITARGVPFHRSIEVQVLENAYGNSRGHTTHGDIFPIHGAKMTPINGRGGSRAFPTEERSRPSPQWNHYRIVCRDGEISLAVNGKVVTRGKECTPRKGYICLESEGGIVHYRNLRIQELPETPIQPDQVAIANRGYRSIYTGLDLSGWQANDQVWKSKDWVLSYTPETDAIQRQPLTSVELFADYGFIVDVRPGKDFQSLELAPHGKQSVTLDLTGSGDAKLGSGWSRIEGEVRGGELHWSVNGEKQSELELNDDSKGPWKLSPHGSMDFANFYVRPPA